MNVFFTSLLKRIYLNRKVFLVLFFLFLALTFISHLTVEKSRSSGGEDHYLYEVQTNAQEEIQKSNEELKTISKILYAHDANEELSFSEFNIETSYPFYIYKKKKIVYWSDYHFVPELKDYENGKKTIYPIEQFNSRFIVNRRRVFGNPESYEIVSLIYLYRDYSSNAGYLKANYNNKIFPTDPSSIQIKKSPTTHLNIYSAKQDFLFSVSPRLSASYHITEIHLITFIFAFCALLLLVAFLASQIWHFHRVHRYDYAFLLLVASLVLGRTLMLYYVIPFAFWESDIFNSKFYGPSPFNPSLGDFALNLFAVAISLFYLVNYYFRMNIYLALINASVFTRQLFAVMIVVLSYVFFTTSFQQLIDIHSAKSLYIYRFDISLTVDFFKKEMKLCCLFIYVLISFIYFSATHICINIFIKLFRKDKRSGWVFFIFASIVVFSITLFWKEVDPAFLILHAAYFSLIYWLNLPRFIYLFRYQTSIYIFVSALFCAGFATSILYNQSIKRDFELKHDFGNKYLAPNDEIGEYMLSTYRDLLKHNDDIIDIFKFGALPREEVSDLALRLFDEKIEYYSHKKSNKVEVNVFDRYGKPLDKSTGAKSYSYYTQRYATKKNQTEHPDLYFVKNPKEELEIFYLEFIKIEDERGIVGYVILKVTPDTTEGYELPVSDEIQPEIYLFSYAIYENGNLISFGGDGFNYEKELKPSIFKDTTLYQTGLEINGVTHVGVKVGNRTIVVSGAKITPYSIFTNFSFLFLVLMSSILLIIVIYAFRYGVAKTNVNFATRVQIYLNGAFLLPLVLVVITTATIVSGKLATNLDLSFINQAESIAISLKPAVKLVNKETTMSGDTVSVIMGNIHQYISIYDSDGMYVGGNRHLTYERGIFSKYINPAVVSEIIEKKKKGVAIKETLGKLEFTTSYVAIKGDDGKLLRILCVPFFSAKTSFNLEILSVLGSLLSVFNAIFIILLILSYFAANSLTVPLRLITNKIKKIDLEKKNEVLTWRSEDEIGVLIRAYNDMLVKLEESKKALADTNKQSAWQQMAKQVAHEIKNPLTPMKLSLQLLQHKLSRGATIDTEQIRGQIDSLTSQIDNLSYIANSFSDFARLPIPKQEIFDFIEVVDKIIGLYIEDKSIRLIRDISMKSVYVKGDMQLTGNIIKNLIVNALQSIPQNRYPRMIMVSVSKGIEAITFSVTDNGVGIPKENQNKIFMMDFSTKKDGSGVGLALAKWVVDNAEGSIWFETREDKGSTFFFTLPLAD